MQITLVTYGMKRKVRPAASTLDMRVNCLKLRDPYHVKAFDGLAANDSRCVNYVKGTPGFTDWFKLQVSKVLVAAVLKGGPVRVGVFCGYGINRSPVVADELSRELQHMGHMVRRVTW